MDAKGRMAQIRDTARNLVYASNETGFAKAYATLEKMCQEIVKDPKLEAALRKEECPDAESAES
jgi:hypothetical protein